MKDYLRRFNWFAFICMVALMAVGVLFVYSANFSRESLKLQLLYRSQAELALFGILAGFGLAAAHYRRVLAWSALFYLAAVVVFGSLVIRENPRAPAPVRAACRGATSFLSDYQTERLLDFAFPDRDPLNRGWNRRQSQIAIGSGGVWGKGFLKGDQNILGYLPQQVSANDFIFSVIAEEAGFAGSVFVLLCYGGLLLSVLAVASAARDGPGRLLSAGVAAMLFCHVFINVAMTVGLAPITGLPLPFLSYGRTFMLAVTLAMGLVQSVAVHGGAEDPAGLG